MPIAEAIVKVLMLLAEPLAKLIENAASDDYDPEVERQALLNMERKLADERLKRLLKK